MHLDPRVVPERVPPGRSRVQADAEVYLAGRERTLDRDGRPHSCVGLEEHREHLVPTQADDPAPCLFDLGAKQRAQLEEKLLVVVFELAE